MESPPKHERQPTYIHFETSSVISTRGSGNKVLTAPRLIHGAIRENLYLVDQVTGEDYTFSTSSIGGRRAVEDLCRQIRNIRTSHPRACPVVELKTEKMKTRFGLKPKPKFQVISWVGTSER